LVTNASPCGRAVVIGSSMRQPNTWSGVGSAANANVPTASMAVGTTALANE
jgi:hypothetical protein